MPKRKGKSRPPIKTGRRRAKRRATYPPVRMLRQQPPLAAAVVALDEIIIPAIAVIPAVISRETDRVVGDIAGVFALTQVPEPLMGTPREVRKQLDGLALDLQKQVLRNQHMDEEKFARIHQYVHKYLMTLVYRRYPYIKGLDENDVYQEALIAIQRKAIPKFNPRKGMSFLNFLKMCVNRHLITLLHASKHRRKDQPINTALSLDYGPADGEDEHACLGNVITNEKSCEPPYKEMDQRECFEQTLKQLKNRLSEFEIGALEEYLRDRSYKDAARNLARVLGQRCDEKSVDNALLRVRKKAAQILEEMGRSALPLLQ